MEEDWTDEAIQRRLEAALEPYHSQLTASLTATEKAEAKEAYLRAFELIFYQCDPGPAFDQAIRKAIDEFLAWGPAGPRRLLRDYRIVREIGSINADVWRTAENLLLGQESMTSGIRDRVEKENRRLAELVRTIRSECPYLLDGRLPQPPLPVTGGRTMSLLISESTLDADYILQAGRGRRMSLRLAQVYRDQGSRPPSSGGAAA